MVSQRQAAPVSVVDAIVAGLPEGTTVDPALEALENADQLGPFQQLVLVVRWGAVLFSSGSFLLSPTERTTKHLIVFALLISWTIFRSLRPIRQLTDELDTTPSVIFDTAIAVLAICVTGYWHSPIVFFVLPCMVIGGFSQTGPIVLGLALASTSLVSSLAMLTNRGDSAATWRLAGQWALALLVISGVAGVGRKVFMETLDRHSETVESVQRLTSANRLLTALHKMAQSLPSSLDLDDVLISTTNNALSLLRPCEVVAILLRNDNFGEWTVARCQGARLPEVLDPQDVPTAIEVAARSVVPISLDEMPRDRRETLTPGATTGLYIPLRARNQTLGVLVIESKMTSPAGEYSAEPSMSLADQKDLARRFAEPAALAIDNARWFGRIKAVTADEERVRIARDLHDRIGQSLAYIGFELDRITKQSGSDPVAEELQRLRGDVRRVVGEVRETLYDIRTDVTESEGLVDTLKPFLDRVRERSGLTIDFDHHVTSSLPSRQERELWLIAQEAIINVERHANASHLRVRWTCDSEAAVVEIEDNGRGFASNAGRVDSYGMRGLRERANAIGARLEIQTEAGKGALVRCRLELV